MGAPPAGARKYHYAANTTFTRKATLFCHVQITGRKPLWSKTLKYDFWAKRVCAFPPGYAVGQRFAYANGEAPVTAGIWLQSDRL